MEKQHFFFLAQIMLCEKLAKLTVKNQGLVDYNNMDPWRGKEKL